MLLYDIVQCAGMNADNYQGVFSEPVFITVDPPETEEGTGNVMRIRHDCMFLDY